MSDRCQTFFNSRINAYYDDFKLIKKYLTSDSIIFDIGANIGMFSLPICESLQYNKIYLFEPSTSLIDFAKMKLSSYPNVTFINKGLSSCNTILTLYKNKFENIGWNSYYEFDPIQPNSLLPVEDMDKEITEVVTLDSFCNQENITRIDFVKIDVEGLEFKVLEGFFSTLRSLVKKPYIYIEVGWGTKHPEWNKVNTIYETLFSIGYHRVEFKDSTEDILFTPIH